MKNRRGFLLAEETLKIVIAVICIGFLVYFLTSLYFNNQGKKELEFAKSSLEHLIEEINSGSTEVEIYNPEGWIVLSWPNNFESGAVFGKKTEQGIPKSCLNMEWVSCLCICEKNNPDNCNDKGICLNNEKGFFIERGIEIKNPPITLGLDKENKKIILK